MFILPSSVGLLRCKIKGSSLGSSPYATSQEDRNNERNSVLNKPTKLQKRNSCNITLVSLSGALCNDKQNTKSKHIAANPEIIHDMSQGQRHAEFESPRRLHCAHRLCTYSERKRRGKKQTSSNKRGAQPSQGTKQADAPSDRHCIPRRPAASQRGSDASSALSCVPSPAPNVKRQPMLERRQRERPAIPPRTVSSCQSAAGAPRGPAAAAAPGSRRDAPAAVGARADPQPPSLPLSLPPSLPPSLPHGRPGASSARSSASGADGNRTRPDDSGRGGDRPLSPAAELGTLL